MSSLTIEAEFTLIPTDEGGREHPVCSGYRPNHKFDEKSYYIGQIEFTDDAWHYPGETNPVTIKFLISPGLEDRIQEGFKWEITEGRHLIGRGIVLRIIKKIE